MRSGIKVVLFFVIASALLGFTQFPIQSAYAAGCTEGDVIHWLNLRVGISEILIHPTEPDIPDDSTTYVQVPRDGGELLVLEFRQQIIADRLNDMGYTQSDGDPVEVTDIGGVGTFTEGYSTICKNGIMQVVGGMLLQPDTATLLIAYGIANSIWLVPSVAGIGIAVYLVKRKL